MTPPGTITSREQLRALYPPPSRPAVSKEIDHLDDHCRALLAHAPFLALSTAGPDGTADSSPRGGPPGFVRVLDDHRLAWGDLSGNNRLDSLENIVERPGVGLLFLVPGLDETLRVNGDAHLTTDPDVLDACVVRDVRPRVAVVVKVTAAYIHCAKALRRSALWHQDRWPDTSDLPTIACMLSDHYGVPELADEQAVEDRLERSYRLTTWLAGGEPPPS